MLLSTVVADQKPHRSDDEQTRNGKRPPVENPWSHPRGSAGPVPTGGSCQHRQAVVNIIDHLHRLGEPGLLRARNSRITYAGHKTLTRPICRRTCSLANEV